MAAWPVVLAMNVDDYKCAKKIREAIRDMRGVHSVSASPEQGLVVVHGTADAWALKRRIWRKMKRHASVLSDGSAPYNYHRGPTAAARYSYDYQQGRAAAPYYGPSQQQQQGYGYGYGWGAAAQPHGYYSQRPQRAYYSQQPPGRSYPYAAGGYGAAGWADPEEEPYYYGSTARCRGAPSCDDRAAGRRRARACMSGQLPLDRRVLFSGNRSVS